MPNAFVCAAVRTPMGKRGGGLSTAHPVDLAAHVIDAVVRTSGVDPAAIDDVLLGCVGQVGAQAFNIGRTAALSAGLPDSVPGSTIDRQCGSSQQALQFASQAVRSGDQDVVVAGGVEVMSLVPIGASGLVGEKAGLGHPRGGRGWRARFGNESFTQFRGAELIAERWGVDRAAMEEYALRSHRLAADAGERGWFDAEIEPWEGVARDEGPRPTTSREQMAALRPVEGCTSLTAAVSSQISDGAAALLVASEAAIARHGLVPLARVHTTTVVGSDPVSMLTGPIPATELVLKKAGLALDDIGLFEVNEAFAPVVLAWQRELGADLGCTNVLGGAIALGHPLGASGARLATTLIHHMRRTGTRYGLQTMCEGGGMANATVFELV
jgi:acetyl-CoA C-acetyltransferase